MSGGKDKYKPSGSRGLHGRKDGILHAGALRCGLTLRTYTHATWQTQQKAAEKMGNFMAQVR